MNDRDSVDQSPEKDQMEKSLFFWFAGLVSRARKTLVVACTLTAVITFVITTLMPKWYESTVTVLPPKDSGVLGSLGSLGSALRDLSPLRALGGGAKGSSYNYLSILESRSAKEAVVRKFDLILLYETSDSSMEKTIKMLEDNISIDVADEGHISLTVFDTDPVRAADMANYLVEILNDLSINLGTREAKENRIFIEKRYLKVVDDLRTAEDSLKGFQRKYGIYSIQEALSGKFLSSFVPLERVPELTMQYIRFYRDLEIQNKILEFALPMYEQAKVDEQKETPVVLVLDPAVPAERKSKPKRLLASLIAALSAGLLTLSAYAGWERVQELRLKSPDRYELLRSIVRLRNK